MSSALPVRKRWLALYGELVGVWARKSRHRQDAEDAAHDAVLGLLEGNASAIDDPVAYLRRSAVNGLVDIHRQRKTRAAVPLHELAEAEHPATQGPEAAARMQELSVALMQALAELPPKCQLVYMRHRLDGWSHPEIAAQLGLSRSMVEKYMTRALRHLNERLRDHAPY